MTNLFLYVTHFDKSIQGLKGPSLCFWGIPQDRNHFRVLIELFIETIRHSLDNRPPPLSLMGLDSKQICCVFINNQWQRAIIPNVKLGQHGTIDVFCIDIGSYHTVPLTIVRTLNFPGDEEENLRNWAPLATSFLLADIVAPLFETGYQWSDTTMMFLRMHIEKNFWKVILIGKNEKYQSARLFGPNNQLLATIMIERKMGVALQTYHDYMKVYTSIMGGLMHNLYSPIMAPPDTFSTGVNIPELPMSNSTTDNSFKQLGNINRTVPMYTLEIPVIADLTDEQDLYVTFAEKPGHFFGQFKKMSDELDKMTNELDKVYSSVSFPTLLYADVKSHLWEYAVLKWDELQTHYRVRITKEMINDAVVLFIDYGNSIRISRSKILAPLDCLTLFRQAPLGIHCQLDNDVSMSIPEWKNLIGGKYTKVKIGKYADGICYVTFANDPCNHEFAKILFPTVGPKMNNLEMESELKLKTDPSSSASLPSLPRRLLYDDRSFKTLDNNVSVTVVWGSRSNVGKLEEDALPEKSMSSTFDHEHQLTHLKQQAIISESHTLHDNEKHTFLNQAKEQVEKPTTLKSIIESETKEPENVNAVPEPLTPLSPNPHKIYLRQKKVLSDHQVEVVSVNDPSSFYVQLLNSSYVLRKLEKKINLIYSAADKSKPAIQDPNPGSPCVVQYTEDSRWYRGQIVEMCDQPSATVFFVDYGYTQRFLIEQIKAIDEDFVKLPPLAVHCKLAGIDETRDWTVEEKSKFESYTLEKLLSATFTIRDFDGKYPVRLLRKTKEGKCVINEDFGAPCFAKIPPPSVGYTSRVVSIKPISVIISCFHNPFRFLLSPVEVTYQDQLEELNKFYSSLSPNDLLEDKPSLGLPCVARFTEDSRYYRSQILSIQNEMAEILFVDYGNQQDTPLSQLKRITPRFMEFPQMTWHCKLKGVKMVDPIGADFQKYIDACFTSNEELTALFHPATSNESNGVFEVDLSVPKIGDASRYLIEHKVLACDLLVADVELAVQDVNFAPQQVLSTNAATGYFVSPTDFWVQLDPKAVDDVMERLDKLALDPDFINKKDFVPSIGKACLAFYETDKRWYRAKVEAVKEDSSTICYIDFGNSCDVKTCDLRGLPIEFAQQPALAFKCCQDGAENFSDAASKFFEEVVVNLTQFSVKFLKVVDGVLCVRLSLDESDVSELCSSALAKSLTEEVVISFTNNLADKKVSRTFISMSDYTSFPVSEALVDVSVSWYYNPYRFFLSPSNLIQYKSQLEEFEIFYSSLSPKELIEDQPTVGLPCVVRFNEDDRYYRSEILSIRESIAELLFVDFGNKQNTPLSQLKRMIPRFVKFPKLAWNCKLAGVQKITTLPINPDAQSHLASCFLTGQTVSAVFHSAGSVVNKGVFDVDLAVPNIGDVSEYLIYNKILERIPNFGLPAQNLNFVSKQVISTRAIASYVKSPAEFWVQLDPKSLDLVTDRIDELVRDPGFSSKNHFIATKGKSCLAFFSEDKRWYRATVEAVNGDTAEVYYLDYGNNCTVKTTKLRELPVQLSRQPALAFKCSLDGSKSLLKDATTSFETFLLGFSAFTVKCLDVSNGVLIVRLFSSAVINLVKQLNSGKVTLPPIQEEESVESIPEDAPTELEGQLSFYSSPNTFWFQLQRNSDEMEKMEIELNQLCQKNSFDPSRGKGKPNANQIYGIKHPAYSTWHRALVCKVFVNTADVYFMDYGDSHVVPFANILALPNRFKIIAPFAIRCRLKTLSKPVELTSVLLLEKLNAVCLEPGTPCKVVLERCENGKVPIFNSFFVGEQNISELLATNIAIEECEKSITLAQHIDQIAGKSWVGEKGSSGLKSHLVIKYVDLM